MVGLEGFFCIPVGGLSEPSVASASVCVVSDEAFWGFIVLSGKIGVVELMMGVVGEKLVDRQERVESIVCDLKAIYH